MNNVATTFRRARKAYATLAPYGKPHRKHLIEGTIATIILVACRLAFPWPLRGLMEIVFGQTVRGGATVVGLVPKTGDPVVWLIGSFVVIILIWGVSESIQRLTYTRFAVGLVRDARAAALKKIPAAERKSEAGDLIAAVTGDASRVKSGIKSVLIGTSRNAAFFVGVTVIVSLIDPVIGLVFFAGGMATIAVGAVGAWRSARIVRRSRRREGELTDDLHRYFAGTADLPKSSSNSTQQPDSKVMRVEGITTFAVHAVLAASTCVILVLAIQGGRSGQLSPGSVFTILAYIMLMHNKTVGFGRRIVRGGRLLPSAERLARLVATKKRKKKENVAVVRPDPPPAHAEPRPFG